MKIEFDQTDLAAIAAAVADEFSRRNNFAERLSPDRLGYPEREAARLLGVASYVLRDARRRGELNGRRLGRSVVYSRQALLAWLADECP